MYRGGSPLLAQVLQDNGRSIRAELLQRTVSNGRICYKGKEFIDRRLKMLLFLHYTCLSIGACVRLYWLKWRYAR